MNSVPTSKARRSPCTGLCSAALVLSAAGLATTASAQGSRPDAPVSDSVSEQSGGALDAIQARLLEIGFEAVSSMPLEPHVKNRSRAQEQIVLAALELDAPAVALEYAHQIENWRRGSCYADYALHLALHNGDPVRIDWALNEAQAIAAWPMEELRQGWRRERILAKVGQVHVAMSEREHRAEDGPVGLKVVTEDTALVRVAEAMAVDREGQRDALLRDLVARFGDAAGDTGPMNTFASAMTILHERYYEDEELRGRVETALRDSLGEMPRSLGVQLLAKLADNAARADDPAGALELLDEARELFEGGGWLVEDEVELQALLAETRARAGDREGAHERTDAALALFARKRAEVVDIWRADALVPVAEAYLALGEEGLARSVYSRALDEGLVNQNPWPQSEDLASVCSSMAIHAVEPDERIWRKLDEALKSIKNAW